MNPETLAIYAQDLSSYELVHIAAVLDDIGQEAPEDYKQLWPAIGTILEAIRGRIRASRPHEPNSIERWNAYVNECMKDPEIKAKFDKLSARLSL